MATWLTPEEFAGYYPPSLTDGVVCARLAPDVVDRAAAMAAEIAQAIEAATDRARTRLLKRGTASTGFDPGELPTDTASTAGNLKRLVADLAWGSLHRGFDHISEEVEGTRAAALDELKEIALCRNLSAIKPEDPAPARRRSGAVVVRAGHRPMTVANLQEDGYLG